MRAAGSKCAAAWQCGYPVVVARVRETSGRRRELYVTPALCGVSDIGLWRETNEDALHASARGVLIVADGLGGLPAGEVASSTAVAAAAYVLEGHDPSRLDRDSAHRLLFEAFSAANQAVVSRAADDPACEGMATALVAALVAPKMLHVAHVGDVRAYRLRSREILRLTEDHTRAWEWVTSGVLSEEAARQSADRNALTRVLGFDDVAPDVLSLDLAPDDVVLLCSDGLWEPVAERDIARILAERTTDARLRAEELADAALRAGGPDNITALVYQHGVSLAHRSR